MLAAVACLLGAFSAATPAARLRQDHPGQYTQAEIDAGARVYSAQCATCHGPNGDRVSGVDLRRGQFRRAVTDEDLAQIDRERRSGRGDAAVHAPAGRD